MFGHQLNEIPIEETLSGMITLDKFWHELNALSSIEVTLSGIIIFVIALQLQNVPLSILDIPSGMVILANL